MQLNKSLILFQYILKRFSYGAFEDLRDEFNHKADGVSSTGYTFWASALMGNVDKSEDDRLV